MFLCSGEFEGRNPQRLSGAAPLDVQRYSMVMPHFCPFGYSSERIKLREKVAPNIPLAYGISVLKSLLKAYLFYVCQQLWNFRLAVLVQFFSRYFAFPNSITVLQSLLFVLYQRSHLEKPGASRRTSVWHLIPCLLTPWCNHVIQGTQSIIMNSHPPCLCILDIEQQFLNCVSCYFYQHYSCP